MKPSINAGLDELASEMNRGGGMGSARGSAGNVMPGSSALGAAGGRTPGSGPTGAMRGIPSRVGAPPSAGGSYMNQPGSPPQNTHAVTPGKVPGSTLGGASHEILAHGRTLGAIAHLRAAHGDHPHFGVLHAKATAGLANMKGKKGVGSKGMPGMSGGFGSLGGAAPITPSGSGPMGNAMGNPQLPDDTAGG